MTSKRRPTTNLPATPASFVGRDADVAGLAQRFEEGRLVTLLGTGGIGKTRLSLRFAEERVEAFSAHRGGGVWFCDLTSVGDRGGIVSAVASALGVKLEAGERDPSDVLGEAIAQRGRILLVLDNFEGLTEHARSTVGLWRDRAPSARFLATSRVPLDVPGELLWRLEPLASDEAVELFTRRARAVNPMFDAVAEQDVVRAIVDAVDRVPLAIELAVTRMSVLSASQLRERLASPLSVLAARNDSGRHASMRRVVLDSVALLDAGARRAFSACAVLRNGFTLEAAEAILGEVVAPRADVLGHLETLVRASLLRAVTQPGGPARYAFFEILRDVAEELLEQEPARAALRAALVTHYADVAPRTGRAALAQELENLRLAHSAAIDDERPVEALAIALAVEPLLTSRGLTRECEELFDATLTTLQHEAPGRAQAHLARGFARLELGDASRARADFDRGLELARAAGASSLAALALTRLGEVSDIEGDTTGARARFDEALALLAAAPQSDDRLLREAEAHLGAGHALRREGALARARTYILRAVASYRALGDDEGQASALYELAVVEMFAGAHDDAFAHFDEGLHVARRGGVRVITGALQTARGCLLQDLGRSLEALEHHAEAVRVFAEAGSRYREASARYYLATAYLERGEPAEARGILLRARARLEGVRAARYWSLMAGAEASALAACGDPDGAAAALSHARASAALVSNEPALVANLRIHELALELRAGRRRATEALAEAEALVRDSPSDDSRFALRMLSALASGETVANEALVVAAGGAAFKPPGGKRVELPARSPLRAIVQHLARRRIDAPGEVTSIDEVVRVGWPAEKIGTDAALNRAYVALASLRKMGLRGLLMQGGGGYALNQAVVVRIEDKGD
jgi:predicted ATPase